MVTFSSSESRFRFWCVYTETFLCLLQTTKVLLSSDQDGDEQLSSDNGPDSEREGTKCKGKGRDSERGRSDVYRRKARTTKEGMREAKDRTRR